MSDHDDPIPHACLAAYFDTPLWRDPARVERIARLLLDERWPWPPWDARCSGIDRLHDRPAVRVEGEPGVAVLVDCLLAPTVSSLWMSRAARDGVPARAKLSTGRDVSKDDAPFDLLLLSRAAALPPGKSTAAWLSLVQALVAEVAPQNAILCVWPTFDRALSDGGRMRIVLDRPDGETELGVPPSAADPTRRWDIGKTHARYPRWGTYLNDAHLAAIGGADRVRAEVAPARIDRIGGLTYIQLTDSIESALTEESEAQRARLEALMAPVLAPRRA